MLALLQTVWAQAACGRLCLGGIRAGHKLQNNAGCRNRVNVVSQRLPNEENNMLLAGAWLNWVKRPGPVCREAYMGSSTLNLFLAPR